MGSSMQADHLAAGDQHSVIVVANTPENSYGKTLVRGGIFNVIGWLCPILVSVVATPLFVRALGIEGYGVYSMLALVTGYLGSLTTPLGEASIKYLAELRGRNNQAVMGQTIFVSLASQGLIGFLAGAVLFLSAGWLSSQAFRVPAELIPTAKLMFEVGGVGLVLNSLQGVVAGIPQALQRFEVFNVINVLAGTANTLIIILLFKLGFGLREIIFVQPSTSIISIVTFCFVGVRLLPGVRWISRFDYRLFVQILQFSFWVFINQWASLLTFQLGRTIIGIALNATQLTYFTIANTLALYLQSFGAALARVIFPLSAELFGADALDRLQSLYVRTMRLFLFVVGGVAVAFVGLGALLLRYWMGLDFEANASLVLAWLAGWGLWHALGSIPYAIANGSGHSRINGVFSILFGLANLAGVLLFLPWGPRGVAFGSFVSTCIVSPFYIGYIQSHILKLKNWQLVSQIGGRFLLSAAITILLARASVGFVHSSFGAAMVALIAGGAYFTVALSTKLISTWELQMLLNLLISTAGLRR
jgi:O-antigen/teichoic acid export membrane protein